jgi:hypothetical protein
MGLDGPKDVLGKDGGHILALSAACLRPVCQVEISASDPNNFRGKAQLFLMRQNFVHIDLEILPRAYFAASQLVARSRFKALTPPIGDLWRLVHQCRLWKTISSVSPVIPFRPQRKGTGWGYTPSAR